MRIIGPNCPGLLTLPSQENEHGVNLGIIPDGIVGRGPIGLVSKSGTLTYQLMGELLNDRAGLQTVHVPFKSAGETMTAVASGTVDFAFAEVTAVLELAKGGRVKILAVAAEIGRAHV